MCYNKGKNVKTILKIVNIIILAILIIVSCIVYNQTKKPSYSYLKSITVYIHGEDKVNEMSWVGTGVIVKITEDYTYILTNRHVAPKKEGTFISVENNVDEFKDALVLKNSIVDDEDMSLIRINGTLKNKQAVKGVRYGIISSRVFMAGNSGAKYYIYREGFISGYDVANYIMQLPVRGGDSGTGIVDKDGYLVGLVFALSLDRGYLNSIPLVLVPNHTLAITMTGRQIEKFLEGEI